MTHVHHRTLMVEDIAIAYREAGPSEAPVVLLLHGFPTSSHMFRGLIPLLAGRYRVVAPDLPGFGFSAVPSRDTYRYTFDHLAETMGAFTETLGLRRYAIYAFDYGAPVGFRMAMAHPDRVTALISQNRPAGNTNTAARTRP
jgi:pimeloyl-ACP methyl ester carboxylesterase